MKAGIKFSHQDGIKTLEMTGAKCAEVYFRLDQKEKYDPLFDYMSKNGIDFGIHFWAIVKGKYSPNLAYNRDRISDETEKLIRETIDIAAVSGATYVNFHPESLRLFELDFVNKESRLVPGAQMGEEEGFASLVHHATNLKQYADRKDVKIYIETVPNRTPSSFDEDKLQKGEYTPVEIEGMPTRKLIELGKRGFDICFDIGHCVAQYYNEPDNVIYGKVLEDAKNLAPFTQLLHVTTNLPPHVGIDSHNGILADDFKLSVLPNRAQLLELFSVFNQANPDIWCIPEPKVHSMIDNHFELKRMLEEEV